MNKAAGRSNPSRTKRTFIAVTCDDDYGRGIDEIKKNH